MSKPQNQVVEAAKDAAQNAQRGAAKAGDHPAIEAGARLGYAASGVLHLLMGWLALRVAWGDYKGSADQSGAFQLLAGTGFGVLMLWVLALGFVLLTLWNLTEAVRRGDTGRRLKGLGKAIAYASLAFSAFGFLRHRGKTSTSQTRDITAKLLTSPGGMALTVAVGLVVIGVGGYHIYKGARRKFREDLVGDPGKPATYAGIVGYVAKGLALLVVGVLFIEAAVQHKPGDSRGIDGALRALMTLPVGQALLTAVAIGLVAYGVYAFFRAKYAKV